ncbi:hypothetical protein OB13_02475 [Pontibacter sp. HJ8]
MLLYRSQNIDLIYDVAYATLLVEWPSKQEPSLLEVRQGLQVLVNYARNYSVNNLLLDSSDFIFNLEQVNYQIILSQFLRALQSTYIKRVARIKTSDPEREQLILKLSETLEPEITLQNFKDKAGAFEWLNTENHAATEASYLLAAAVNEVVSPVLWSRNL